MSVPRPPRAGLFSIRRGPVDTHLKVLVVLLVGLGLVMVYSASSVLSMVHYGKSTVFFTSQLTRAVAGFVLMMVVAAVDYRIWEKVSKPLLWLSILLLVVPAVGISSSLTPEINGARRWIVLPGFQFQPLAVARLALVVWMAATIARKGTRLDRFSDGLGPLLAVPVVMAGLLLLQPDFKGAGMLLALAGTLLFVAGVRLRHLAVLAAAGIPILGVALALEPYRLQRLSSYLDRDSDIQGLSYQIHQSLISLGSGGWFGVGLGASKQKFAFLPAAYNDFIFSILGEELGILGTVFVLIAFLYLGWLGYRIARRAPDGFGFLLASGMTTVIVMSALVNMGVATATLPTTGLTLPFISYGGTELVVHLVMIGILLAVSRDAVDDPAKVRREARAGRRPWWRFFARRGERR
jgi:cell division protein FtsW